MVGGNATGYHIPLYYIFPGKWWSDAFLNDAAPGSDDEMSEGFICESCNLVFGNVHARILLHKCGTFPVVYIFQRPKYANVKWLC
jgi:hypothetical protein